MSRKTLRHRVESVVGPVLTGGEHITASGPTWAVEHRGRVPLLLRARDQHVLVLTDQRMILFTVPTRRRPLSAKNLVLAKRYSSFEIDRVERLRPLLQVRLRTSDGRVLVLEFGPRDRGVGRALVDAIESPTPGDSAGVAAQARGRRGEADAREDTLDLLRQ